MSEADEEPDIVEKLRSRSAWIVVGCASEAADEIERLRAQNGQLTAFNARRYAERDEARRMYCETLALAGDAVGRNDTPQSIAQRHGWDCYDTGGRNESRHR